MKRKLLSVIPYSVVLIIDFYLLPLFIRNTGLAMLFMLMVIPLISFGCALVYGIKRGISFIFPVTSMLLFLPTVFIYYNSSALIYVLIYGVVTFIGNLLGNCFYNKK